MTIKALLTERPYCQREGCYIRQCQLRGVSDLFPQRRRELNNLPNRMLDMWDLYILGDEVAARPDYNVKDRTVCFSCSDKIMEAWGEELADEVLTEEYQNEWIELNGGRL